MGVHIYIFAINITASEVMPPNNAPNLEHLTGQKIVFGIEKYFDGIRYLDQSQKIGIWIQYLDISYLVITHDMGYDITIYRDISGDITPDHLETPGTYKFYENPPPRCGLLLCCSALSLPSSWLVLRLAFFVDRLLSIGWTHHRTDRTSKQQPCPLRTPPVSRARAVCFCFIFIYFFLFIFSFPVCFPYW